MVMIRPHRCFGFGSCRTPGCYYADPERNRAVERRWSERADAHRRFVRAVVADVALLVAAMLGALASNECLYAGLVWPAALALPAIVACLLCAHGAGTRARRYLTDYARLSEPLS